MLQPKYPGIVVRSNMLTNALSSSHLKDLQAQLPKAVGIIGQQNSMLRRPPTTLRAQSCLRNGF